MGKLILLVTILLFVPIAAAQFQITHPSIVFTDYQSTLTQLPGTTTVYSVNVTNVGDVRIDKVYLTLSFLPSNWYEIEEGKSLDVGETKKFTYAIKLPKDALGSLDLELTAHAIRGFGEVNKTRVNLKLIAGNVVTQTTTAPTITSTSIVHPQKDFLSENATLIVVILIVFIFIELVFLFRR